MAAIGRMAARRMTTPSTSAMDDEDEDDGWESVCQGWVNVQDKLCVAQCYTSTNQHEFCQQRVCWRTRKEGRKGSWETRGLFLPILTQRTILCMPNCHLKYQCIATPKDMYCEMIDMTWSFIAHCMWRLKMVM